MRHRLDGAPRRQCFDLWHWTETGISSISFHTKRSTNWTEQHRKVSEQSGLKNLQRLVLSVGCLVVTTRELLAYKLACMQKRESRRWSRLERALLFGTPSTQPPKKFSPLLAKRGPPIVLPYLYAALTLPLPKKAIDRKTSLSLVFIYTLRFFKANDTLPTPISCVDNSPRSSRVALACSANQRVACSSPRQGTPSEATQVPYRRQ